MSSKVKLLFLCSGKTAPSSRFRVMQFVPYLQAAGHRCDVSQCFPQKYDEIPWLGFRLSQLLKRLNRYVDLLRARWKDYDAIILERELFHNATVDMERKFRRLAKTLVLDIDDAIFLNFPEKARELTTMVDLVFAGNPLLMEWASQFNSRVEYMPTCIDTKRYSVDQRVDRKKKTPVVGWMGTSSNLVHLSLVAAALRETAKQSSFELRIVSNDAAYLSKIDFQGVNVMFVPWSAESELSQLSEMDIGMMPLMEDKWNHFKCGAKLLQYMGLGIPSIASPIGVNAQIICHKQNGFLASTTEEWSSIFLQLLSNEELRSTIGRAGRKTVEDSYSVEHHASRWVSAVESTIGRLGDSFR